MMKKYMRAGFLLSIISLPAFAGAVITNGSGIYLGVNDHGQLNYTDGVTTTLNGSGGAVGVAINADLSAFGRGSGLFDATSPGCLCEGWGASASGVSGWANQYYGGVFNLSLTSFASTASTATSITTVDGTTLQVTHAFGPSSNPALMLATVTLENTGVATLTGVRYNRTMDWDVPPSEFNEFVEIFGWPASALLNTSNNGFAVPDPLLFSLGYGGCPTDANFTAATCGPGDHGAFFTFGFGDLAPGQSISFDIFYGAAASRTLMLAALGAVGAEVYSLGMSARDGTPLTYAFGFRGVGGTPIGQIPEPGTYATMFAGLAGVWLMRRRAGRRSRS
jgi:type IV pilus assembly protein PilY1